VRADCCGADLIIGFIIGFYAINEAFEILKDSVRSECMAANWTAKIDAANELPNNKDEAAYNTRHSKLFSAMPYCAE
jgi:Co/Zn/Cd efflux system component